MSMTGVLLAGRQQLAVPFQRTVSLLTFFLLLLLVRVAMCVRCIHACRS